jgi:regulator of protease activity HflC (stomatin/prohibitin superfamily)
VAKYDAEELITKREIVKSVIANAIRNSLSAKDMIVETIFITDFRFSPAFSSQVEDKVVAYQKYLTELNNLRGIQVVANQTVVQAQAQAKANIAKADGESQAIRIITSQLRQDPQYLSWQAINKWNGQMPYSFGGQGALPFFQLPQSRSSTLLQQPQSPQQQLNQSK